MPRLVALVSPHGFGHAARTAAVLAALAELAPETTLEIWSTVPEWFFRDSLGSIRFDYRKSLHDVGLVQRTALAEDLPATVAALGALWRGDAVEELARELERAHADAVLCDISPLGLAAARRAGLRSILLENFTWDWIYEGYLDAEPRLRPWVELFGEISSDSDLRLRAAPACPKFSVSKTKDFHRRGDGAGAEVYEEVGGRSALEVSVGPIARRTRSAAAEVRERLGISPGRPMVLVSLGGIETAFENLDRWRTRDDVDFVVPGAAVRDERRGNLVLLPHHSPVYHPDLVRAADVVVGKLGYSTVAEAYAAGTRFAYLPRPAFRESAVLEQFVRENLPSTPLDPAEFDDGRWTRILDALLASPKAPPQPSTAAKDAATAIECFLEAVPQR